MKYLKPLPLLCLLMAVLSGFKAMAQTPYYDAVALRKLVNDASKVWPGSAKTQVANILANYCAKDSVPDVFTKNPFTKDLAAVVFVNKAGVSGGQNPVVSALGGFNVTSMANGLALFLIDRAKDEIDEAFFVRLNDFLNQYPEFATLFPNTNTFLSSFNSWQYANLLNTLKEAFNKDINSLPADLIKLRTISCNSVKDSAKNAKCAARLKIITDFLNSKDGLLLLSAFKIGDGLIQGNKVPDVIAPVISANFLLNNTIGLSDNTKNGLQLLNIIDKSIKSNETGKSYITAAQFSLLTSDVTLQNIYLGLIWEQMARANSGTGLVFKVDNKAVNITTDIFKKTQIDGIMSYLTNVFNQASDLQTAFDNLKKDRLDAKPNVSPDYAAVIESVQQVFQSLRTTTTIDARLAIPADADVFFDNTNAVLQIAGQLFNSNYGAAVTSSLTLLKTTVTKYNPQSDAKAELTRFCQNFLTYASFAANFAEAKTPDDAKAAIEAVALPVGSYTIKQKSEWNISVNGYVGYTFDLGYAHGIYAPVGFAFSHGSTKKNGWAVTLFTGLIDVGSMVSYNLESGQSGSQKQEVRLESIFSPSAALFLEIGRTPISFGGGYRQTPKLFYSTTDGSYDPVPAKGVFTLSVLIDIPLFTLHNTPFP
jgi:hypothetical protein